MTALVASLGFVPMPADADGGRNMKEIKTYVRPHMLGRHPGAPPSQTVRLRRG